MATAKRSGLIEGVYPTPATLYEVDPPIVGASHVVVFWTPPAIAGQAGRTVVVRATPNGGSFTRQVEPTYGTHPSTGENHALALEIAGRSLGVGPYEIVAPGLTPDPATILAEAEAAPEPDGRS